eukprot:Phypoly_transcript_01562.p1 GENE.Phypoly_transcript_01562~~Phypoly_transcript_01562.p1  ORF type:complete len:996 (+),score=153.51 Phypoly_transcript_01562:124-3111(+)
MAEKSAMFCASCGTASAFEGNCPQCSAPMKRLGRVGAITESKRATQRMINKSSIGFQLDLQSMKRTPSNSSDSDSSGPAYLTMYRPTNSPRGSPRSGGEHSPRQSPRLHAPALVSPRLLQQFQQTSLVAVESEPPMKQENTSQTQEHSDQTTDVPPNTERKSYFSAISRVFSWRNKDQRNAEGILAASPLGSSSADLSTLSLPHPSAHGIRVLPHLNETKILRRRSTDATTRSTSAAQLNGNTPPKKSGASFFRKPASAPIDHAPNNPFPTDISSSPKFTPPESNFAPFHSTSDSLSPLAASAPLSYSPLSAHSFSDSDSFSDSSDTTVSLTTTTPSISPASNSSSASSTTASSPTASSATSSAPLTTSSSAPIPISSSTSASLDEASVSEITPDVNSPRALVNSPRSTQSAKTAKGERPTRVRPNLKVVIDNNNSDENINNNATKTPISTPTKSNEGFLSPLQLFHKIRHHPSSPVQTPTSPFTGISPSLVSPRSHRTPPRRALPTVPTTPKSESQPIPKLDSQATPKSESHPTILRRNTVHNDLHVVKPSDVVTTPKDAAPDWLSLAQPQKQPPTKAFSMAELPSSPKGEVTLVPIPKVEFFHPHIPPPPQGLSSDEMREKIALELITTEYEYVNDVYTLVCAKNEMEKCIHKNELSSIFNNIDQIYKVNEAIYKKMVGYCASVQKRRLDGPSSAEDPPTSSADDKVAAISRTFLGLAHTMKIYVKYSLGHQRALEKLKTLLETDEYGPLLKRVEAMPGFKSSEMSGYLIKPVQRICRYPLLIKEIVKSTPAGHHTLEELQEALNCVEQTLQEINEAQGSIERELNLMRAQHDLRLFGMDIDVMSPTRSLVLDGPIRLVPVIRKTGGSKIIKKPKEGHYFLFDDFFLFVMNTKKKETPHIFIPAEQSLVKDPGENALEIIHSGQDIWMFVLPSYHDKVFLMQKLNQIIDENLQETRRAGGPDKVGKSTLNMATLSRTKSKKKKKGLGDMFSDR